MTEEEFLEFSKKLYQTFIGKKGVLSDIFGKQPDSNDKAVEEVEIAQNIVLTFSPEALLTVLICLAGADNDAIQKANVSKAYGARVKPASTITLYSTVRDQARKAGVIK